MYVLNLIYKKPEDEITAVLEEHISYLDKYYQSGNFLFSGVKRSGDGGVIVANFSTAEAVDLAAQADPFFQLGLTDYEILDFEVVKSSEDFRKFQA